MLTETSIKPAICFDNSYVKLGGRFYAKVKPTLVEQPGIVKLNYALAQDLGIDFDALDPESWAAIFSGNQILSGSEPLAMVYAGHQFGNFVPQLGDGRAILLGEVIDNANCRRDIQLKGAGLTPFSRQGDGRAALGPVLREYIISEAMHALGIPTTRSLGAVTTGEPVYREKVLPGAVLTRVALGHVRTGTFQYFAVQRDEKELRQLADYVIARHFPELKEEANPYLKLLEEVMEQQAQLVAKWMHVGFIHGVMNTDNMAISGETIDYGPCAFMDNFSQTKVFSSIDRMGRYAYGNQPSILQWNLTRFAETILPLIDKIPERAVDFANEVIEIYPQRFREYWLSGMRQKLGLFNSETEDESLIQSLLETMQENEADFTLTFRRLCDAALTPEKESSIRILFNDSSAYDNWAMKWRDRLSREFKTPEERFELMCQTNPTVIPRNHQVQLALKAAEEDGDYAPFEKLLEVLSSPYAVAEEYSEYLLPPKPDEHVLQTFCGT